ncbi:MAG: BMP family ABC transporter substrate-binding protein [Antricoccus sp.]
MRRLSGIRRGAVIASILAAALGMSACSSSSSSGSGSGDSASAGGMKVGVAFDVGGRGDKSFNDSAAAGIDKAVSEFKLAKPRELSGKPDETDSDKEDRLRQLADGGAKAIICVGFSYAPALEVVSKDYPDVKFQILDNGTVKADNVVGYTFKDNENAYLVGYLAASASKTGTIGFVGGVNETLINNFQVGFESGAKAGKSDIKIETQYLTEAGDYSGYSSPDKGKIAAEGIYDKGADIVYAAAGLSNNGVFEAAAEKKHYAIGTDSDQYLTADASYKNQIIASALKRLDTASYNFLKSVKGDTFKSGNQSVGIKEDGVGYVINNEQIKGEFGSKVDAQKEKIARGEIKVPSKS